MTFYLQVSKRYISIKEGLKTFKIFKLVCKFKAQTQLKSRRDDGSESGRNYRGCQRGVLEVSPKCRASPEAMGHDVL